MLKHAPVNDGLALSKVSGFDFFGYVVQEKLDGWRAFLDGDSGELIGRNHRFGFYKRTVPGWFFDGELMPDGEFIAFDCLRSPNLGDISKESQVFRLDVLSNAPIRDTMSASGDDAVAFAKFIKARGGEGIVAKLADKPYGRGGWLRFKREFTREFVVLDSDDIRNSCEVADLDGKSVGRIAGGGHCLPGSIVEVKAMQYTAEGKLRHGRFVRERHDLSRAPSHPLPAPAP